MAKETWAQISKRKLSVYPKCKICKKRHATQFHHGIEWRMKKHKKVLDYPSNETIKELTIAVNMIEPESKY